MDRAPDDLEKISNLLHTPGSPSEFGCSEGDLESIKRKVCEIDGAKNVRAVKNWMIWDLDVNENDAKGLTKLGFRPQIMYSSNIIFDLHEPYLVGTCVRTTPLVKFTENCLFETKNTIYILVDSGTRKTVDPKLAMSVFF